jgi:ribose transport system ATP-binding protein
VIVIFGGRVVDILPVEIADEAALTRASYGLPRGVAADVGVLAATAQKEAGAP